MARSSRGFRSSIHIQYSINIGYVNSIYEAILKIVVSHYLISSSGARIFCTCNNPDCCYTDRMDQQNVKRRGRPRGAKPPRDQLAGMAVTADEMTAIRQAARERGLTVSQYLRSIVAQVGVDSAPVQPPAIECPAQEPT
jgi:hypothetical protein